MLKMNSNNLPRIRYTVQNKGKGWLRKVDIIRLLNKLFDPLSAGGETTLPSGCCRQLAYYFFAPAFFNTLTIST